MNKYVFYYILLLLYLNWNLDCVVYIVGNKPQIVR